MYVQFGSLNMWPHRNIIINNSPVKFQSSYKNVIGSIVCTEFFTEKLTSLIRQSQCYSNYKSHATLKALILVDPNAIIMLVSQLFTVFISDKSIVVESGFVDCIRKKLEIQELYPDDIILADKGFDISSLFGANSIKINIPNFRISGMQFSEEEVENSRCISKGRIHVERAISRPKSYGILRKTIPISQMGSINEIFSVCCMLCNLRKLLRRTNPENTMCDSL